jgi:hypothetical protein
LSLLAAFATEVQSNSDDEEEIQLQDCEQNADELPLDNPLDALVGVDGVVDVEDGDAWR